MSTADPGALGVLLAELIDDAALFPPGDAPLARAVPAHLAHDAGSLSGLLGRFLCPVSKLPDLKPLLSEDDDLRLGLIADTGLDGLPGRPNGWTVGSTEADCASLNTKGWDEVEIRKMHDLR